MKIKLISESPATSSERQNGHECLNDVLIFLIFKKFNFYENKFK